MGSTVSKVNIDIDTVTKTDPVTKTENIVETDTVIKTDTVEELKQPYVEPAGTTIEVIPVDVTETVDIVRKNNKQNN